MKEFIRRLKSAHVEEKKEVAEVPEALPLQHAVPRGGISRRAFFERYAAPAAATVALSALPNILHADMAEAARLEGREGARERERVIENKVRAVREALNSPEVRAARMGQGDRIFSRVVRAIQFPVTPQFIKGTKFDMEVVRKKHCVQFAYEWQGKNKPHLMHWISNKLQGFKKDTEAACGNGVYFGALNKFLTARHNAAKATQREFSGGKRDLHVMNRGSVKCLPEQLVVDDPSLTNAHIDGAFVSIEGIDPDATADSEGYKSYPGVAVRLSREFVNSCFTTSPPDMKEWLARSFMVVVPAGEATGDGNKKPIKGMSGSPVFTLHNGERTFAGIMFSVADYNDNVTNTSYDVAFFHGIEEVRAQVQEQNRTGA